MWAFIFRMAFRRLTSKEIEANLLDLILNCSDKQRRREIIWSPATVHKAIVAKLKEVQEHINKLL